MVEEIDVGENQYKFTEELWEVVQKYKDKLPVSNVIGGLDMVKIDVFIHVMAQNEGEENQESLKEYGGD